MIDKIIIIRIKILRGNFFVLISNQSKKLIFNKSCGNVGFKNIQKRTKDAFQKLLSLSIRYLLRLSIKNKLLIMIDLAKREVLNQIYNQFINVLKSYKFNVFSVMLINKISHNGCRKSYFRK
jgi:ribosomal protein S11